GPSCNDADGGEERIRQRAVIASQSEKRALVHHRRDHVAATVMVRLQLEVARHDEVRLIVLEPAKDAVLAGLIRQKTKQGQRPEKTAKRAISHDGLATLF